VGYVAQGDDIVSRQTVEPRGRRSETEMVLEHHQEFTPPRSMAEALQSKYVPYAFCGNLTASHRVFVLQSTNLLLL